MQVERTKNATRNIAFGLIQRIVQIVAPFCMRTVLIYVMGVEYLGLSSLFTSILQVLNLAELGVGSAMVYSMYQPIASNDHVKICALLNLYKKYYRIIGLIIGIIGLLLTPFIPNLIKSNVPEGISIYVLYLMNLCSTVFSYFAFAYKSSVLQANQRNDIVSKVVLGMSVVQYSTQILVIVIKKDYYYYTAVAVITQLLTNIVTALFASRLFPQLKAKGKLPKTEIIAINHRIRDLFTSKLGSAIVGSADTIVISAFLGLTYLAVYQNYYFVLISIFTLVGVFFSSVTAGMGNSLVTETIEKNYRDFRVFTFFISWIVCICCCCFASMYQCFMQIWVGEKYMLDNSFVLLFCIYFYVLELSMAWATIKDAAGLWHQDRYRPLIGSLFNLLLNLLLVKVIGLYGIVISTILSYLIITMPWLIHNLFSLLYKRSPKLFLRELLLYLFITICSTCLSFLFGLKFPISGIGGLVIRGIFGVIISNCMFYISFRKKEEFLYTKGIIKRIINRGFFR